MNYYVKPSKLSGEIRIPGSKSHTIRALIFALLAEGESILEKPLDSEDTKSCLEMILNFGARFKESGNSWNIEGRGGKLLVPEDVVNIGNSGTSLYLGMGLAAITEGCTIFTGDHQIRNRPAETLLKSFADLGAETFSSRGNGKPPLIIRGPIKGGHTSIEAVTSQYLTSLLISAPLASGNTEIDIPLLYEKPYVTMTLKWLDDLGIEYNNDNYKKISIKGSQTYKNFKKYIPADFSSAAFFIVAATITKSEITLRGLDFNDSQGDKELVDILINMGADIKISKDIITIKGSKLKGGTYDLNSIPDALPALSVAACFAEGQTKLMNVPQARLKETDRIAVMYKELSAMGADIQELEDGLIIKKSLLKGGSLNGHYDHRVVMALSAAGLAAKGDTTISTAESAAVTFPAFFKMMLNIGAKINK